MERRKCRHDATMPHLRYDGEIAVAPTTHAINLGVRFSW